MNFNVTIGLTPAFEKLLTRLVDALEGQHVPATVAEAPVKGKGKAKDKVTPTPPSVEVVEEVQEATEEVVVEPEHTLEELREFAKTVAVSKEQKTALKQLLTEYGASSISTLAKEHYDAFYAGLAKING